MAKVSLTPLGKWLTLCLVAALLLHLASWLPSPTFTIETRDQHSEDYGWLAFSDSTEDDDGTGPVSRRASGSEGSHVNQEGADGDSNASSGDSWQEDSGSQGSSVPEKTVKTEDGEVDLDHYTCKGAQLLQATQATAEEATTQLRAQGRLKDDADSQSIYVGQEGRNKRRQYGWQKNHDDPNINQKLTFFGGVEGDVDLCPIGDAMKALHLDTDSGASDSNNQLVAWQHSADYYVGTKPKHATCADYLNVYNPRDGILIGHHNYSPNERIETHEDLFQAGVEAPPLSHWSDIVFLEHQEQSGKVGKPMKDLKYVFQSMCENEVTNNVVGKILEDHRTSQDGVAKLWAERTTFQMDTEEGQAILATPNGEGVAWLLIQHKGPLQFGRKTIRSVTVFRDNRPADFPYKGPSLVFELADVA